MTEVVSYGERALTPLQDYLSRTFQSIKAWIPHSLVPLFTPETGLTASVPSQPSTILNLLFFIMSNKTRPGDDMSMGYFSRLTLNTQYYELINKACQSGLLDYLLDMTGPTAEALVEEVFSAAIETEDVGTVNKILATGVRPDDLSCSPPNEFTVTPLQRACWLRSIALTETLLEHGANVNKAIGGTHPPLSQLIEASYSHGHGNESRTVDLVKILLEAGACVEGSALYFALKASMVEVTHLLLQAGADPNFIHQDRYMTVLEVALDVWSFCDRTHMVVKALIEAGADVSDIDGVISGGMVEFGLYDDVVLEIMKDLLDRGACATGDDLSLALESGSCDAVKLLVEHHVPITSKIIEEAVCDCDSNILKILLASKVPVTEKAMATAVKKCTKDDVCLLLDSDLHSNKRKKTILQRTALVSAIRYGRKDIMDIMFESGVKLEHATELSVAIEDVVRRGDLSLLQFLLSDNSPYRSSVVRSMGGSLCLAIRGDQPEMLKLLLKHDANSDRPLLKRSDIFVDDVCLDSFCLESTPLMEAIIKQDTTLIQMLLAAGAAVNVLDGEVLYSVLPGAVSWGDIPCIRQLIAAGANPNVRGMSDKKTALVVAIEKSDFDMIRLLMDSGADVNALSRPLPALAAAIQTGDIRIVHYLLDRGADPNEEAVIAAVRSDIGMMRMVLESRLVRYKGLSLGFGCVALQHAIYLIQTEKVKLLLDYGVNPNTIYGCPDRSMFGDRVLPLHHKVFGIESCLGTAIRLGDASRHGLVRMLLQAGADPNSIVQRHDCFRSELNISALGAAVEGGDASLVEILLKAGAPANGKFVVQGRYTALQYAVKKGLAKMVNLLIEHQAEVIAPAHWDHGATALQFAAITGDWGHASTLLEKGADVDAAGAEVDGRTALEGAAEYGRIDMVQLLINAGAQVTGSGSKQYERAVKFATANGHAAVRRMLEKIHSEKVAMEESREGIESLGGNEWGGVWEM